MNQIQVLKAKQTGGGLDKPKGRIFFQKCDIMLDKKPYVPTSSPCVSHVNALNSTQKQNSLSFKNKL